MENSQMKNIVVLKNLPSNLIEGAFVIVKSKKTAKTLEYIDKKDRTIQNKDNTKDYIIREAESVISNYIKLAQNKDDKKSDEKLKNRYKWLKIYSIIITLIFLGVIILI